MHVADSADSVISRSQRFCPDIPVIVTSGFLRPDFSIPYEVMYKPFDYNELEELIRQRLA